LAGNPAYDDEILSQKTGNVKEGVEAFYKKRFFLDCGEEPE